MLVGDTIFAYYFCNAKSTINITPCLFVSQSNYYMKNLKKFQAFALTQEEQKNVTGGLLAAWRCITEDANGGWSSSTPGDGSAGAAVAYCRSKGSSCIGCSN